jgi:hypothetical protein
LSKKEKVCVMGSHGKKKSVYASTWLTQTQLGEYFALTAREIGLCLVDLGLRAHDATLGDYQPTEKARAENYCMYSPLRNGEPFYVWHRQRTLQLLQEKVGLVPLRAPDLEARATALDLIQAEKEAERGNDKLYYLLFDSIPLKKLPCVMAWALFTTHQKHDPIYANLRESVADDEIPAINHELARIGADLQLQEGEEEGGKRDKTCPCIEQEAVEKRIFTDISENIVESGS